MFPRRPPLALALAGLIALPAHAADYSAALFFGDSLSDAGWYAPLLGGFGEGVGSFTTNPGPVWAELLAGRLGLAADPANAGGSNYAQGGARVERENALFPGLSAMPLRAQVDSYLEGRGGHADGAALYLLWGGANDVFYGAEELGDPLAAAAYLVQTSGHMVEIAADLRRAGARHLVVITLPDMGTTPGALAQGPAAAAGLTALSEGYNRELFGQLRAAGIEVIPLDVFNLLREVQADPAAYGFSNVTTPACRGALSALCGPDDLVAPGADLSYLFADGVHPTTGAHRILGDYAWGMLNAPAQIAMLAEGPAATGRLLLDTLQGSARRAAEGQGLAAWVSGGAARLEIGEGAGLGGGEGGPQGLTLGVDHAGGGAAWGVALGVGRFDADYPGSPGGFTQEERSLSLYGRFSAGPLGVGLSASAADLSVDSERVMVLGPARRRVAGETDGSRLALAVEVDYPLGGVGLRHGPLAGLEVGQVHVDGFTESDRAGVATALSYGSQRRDLLLARIGYQAAWEQGSARPYGRIALEHDFEAGERSLAVTLPSVYDTRYHAQVGETEPTALAVSLGSDWLLGEGITGWMELNARAGEALEQYGATAGVRFGF